MSRENTLTRVLHVLHGENARMRETFAGIARLSVEPKTPRKAQSMRPVRVPRRSTVLIVEDDGATGRLYVEALSAMRAEPFLAPTMVEARELASTAEFDVAVIDLVMRETLAGGLANGADIIPIIRARSPETRIVISTGLQDAAAREMLLTAGVDPSSVEIVPKVAAHEIRAVVAR